MGIFQRALPEQQISLKQPESFAKFYEQTHLSVFRYVMVLCAGNQTEAEDITADAFFRAWEKRATFSGTSSAALGWVITIARNCLIDDRRRANLHPVESTIAEDLTDPLDSVEDLLVDSEQFQQVLEAIQTLPFTQANILTLRYGLGWQVKTIAAHLGLAENTVSVALRRALAKLQKKLAAAELLAGRAK